MGCGSAKQVETVDTSSGKMLGKPKASGDKQPLFNGLLYRIIDQGSGRWAFFNNSKDYEFHIKYLFGAESNIVALGDTEMVQEDDGLLCKVVVYPLETKDFIEGTPDGFESKLEALPLSEWYFSNHPELDEEAYFKRLQAPKAREF